MNTDVYLSIAFIGGILVGVAAIVAIIMLFIKQKEKK